MTTCMKISLVAFSYSGADWGNVENGDMVSETRSGRDGEEALASMGYKALLAMVEETVSATHCGSKTASASELLESPGGDGEHDHLGENASLSLPSLTVGGD